MRISFAYQKLKKAEPDLPEYTSDPASGADGEMILNTTSNQVKVWYTGGWRVITTLNIGYEDILLEDGDIILLESGDVLDLEIPS